MGKLPSNNRQYHVQAVQERHREILRRLVIGESPKVIAAALGITPQNVSDVRNSDLCKEELAKLSAARDKSLIEIPDRIKDTVSDALLVMKDCLLDPDPKIKMAAAKDLLDRGGFVPIKRVQNENTTLTLTPEDIKKLKERARPFRDESEPIDIIATQTAEG